MHIDLFVMELKIIIPLYFLIEHISERMQHPQSNPQSSVRQLVTVTFRGYCGELTCFFLNLGYPTFFPNSPFSNSFTS